MKQRGSWKVELLSQARRELIALRTPVQDRIRAALRELAEDPMPASSIPMKGKGTGLYRLRIGTYRVVYRIESARVTVLVIRIGHRAEVYSGWEPRRRKGPAEY